MPVDERRHGERRGDAERALDHAAEEDLQAVGARHGDELARRGDAAALGELDVDAVEGADQLRHVGGFVHALVGDEQRGLPATELTDLVEAVGGERLFDEFDAEPGELRQARERAVVRSSPRWRRRAAADRTPP